MSRKPVNKLLERHKLQPRDRIWKFIRGRKDVFSTIDISNEVKINLGHSRPYLNALAKAGYIEVVSIPDRICEIIKYKFVKGPLHAPRLKKDGSPVTQGLGQDHMWRTMQMLGVFSFRELATCASTEDVKVSLGSAKQYVLYLAKAGFVKKLDVFPAQYKFLKSRYTGPQAPMIQTSKTVYDPNIREVVWPIQEGDEE